MAKAFKEFDTKLDERKRLTLSGAEFENYHVIAYDDGSFRLEPRILVAPAAISRRTLAMMDSAVNNLAKRKTSKPVDPAALRRAR